MPFCIRLYGTVVIAQDKKALLCESGPAPPTGIVAVFRGSIGIIVDDISGVDHGIYVRPVLRDYAMQLSHGEIVSMDVGIMQDSE